jgi:hypothetical protein
MCESLNSRFSSSASLEVPAAEPVELVIRTRTLSSSESFMAAETGSPSLCSLPRLGI